MMYVAHCLNINFHLRTINYEERVHNNSFEFAKYRFNEILLLVIGAWHIHDVHNERPNCLFKIAKLQSKTSGLQFQEVLKPFGSSVFFSMT